MNKDTFKHNIKLIIETEMKDAMLKARENPVVAITKEGRLRAAQSAFKVMQNALDSGKIVSAGVRQVGKGQIPKFETPMEDHNFIRHAGVLYHVHPRTKVATEVVHIAPSDSGHLTVVLRGKGNRAGKTIHIHAGNSGEDFIEHDSENTPYRVSLVGGKRTITGLPDLSEDYEYCYDCELKNRLEEGVKKKIAAGLAAATIGLGLGTMGIRNDPQIQTAAPTAIQNFGGKQEVKQEKKQRQAHEMAARVIRERESFRDKAYNKDGHWTIGWGNTRYSNGKEVQPGDTITREQADKEFEHHVHNVVMPKMAKIPHWDKMSEHQKAALISFSYNTGENFYRNPNFKTIAGALSSPDNWHKVGDAMKLYNKGLNEKTGKKERLRGLDIRRGYEAQLWSGQEPEFESVKKE